MPDNVDFWAMLIGIVAAGLVFATVYGLIELADARQHARYRRAQQGRINRRFGVFHEGGQ